jgi:hypothetical protein
LVLQDDALVHVTLVHRNAVRLILLPEVVAEVITVSFSSWSVLAILSHLRIFQLLIVYLDFLLVS